MYGVGYGAFIYNVIPLQYLLSHIIIMLDAINDVVFWGMQDTNTSSNIIRLNTYWQLFGQTSEYILLRNNFSQVSFSVLTCDI
jgi:hypothetical protein